ncbi:glycosyltransferase [Paenibacillus aurantius]|uniref:Glycosyltransferase n=1 Tax=Paenibacillus aurantius TaxID=2918900 RepID=A0AA96REP9_9BACL|nr:glycosyltransferase [Paenibacillus aurantius]WNQ10423.1 glycosyltransferase [Paenibacillus aurantius]
MEEIKISLIMPNYNGEKYLKRSIESFLEQDYEYKELIIIDGKSQDSSHEIIQGYAEKFDSIVWLRCPDSGISDAINNGLMQSTGDIIGYLGSDDILIKDILTVVYSTYKNLVELDALYFNSYTFNKRNNEIELRRCPRVKFTKENLIIYGTIVGLQNIFFRKSIYKDIGFNVLNKYSMDYEFYLEISEKGYLYLHLDEAATINIFDGNISGTLQDRQYLESLFVAKKFADRPSLQVLINLKIIKFRIKNVLKGVLRKNQ